MSSLSSKLTHQIYADKFDFLKERLGPEIVEALPNYYFSKDCPESDYPSPWPNPQSMIADACKGVLNSQRPFLALRYVEVRTNKLVMEIFFQRYAGVKENWAAIAPYAPPSIHKGGGVSDEEFALIKDLLLGKDSQETKGFILPIYLPQ